MKKITKLIVNALSVSVALSVAGCAVGPWGGIVIGNPFAGMAEARQAQNYKEKQEKLKQETLTEIAYAPPQVIYRIDKNRYITLEKYTNCDNGQMIYHNDEKNIKTLLWVSSRGVMNYKGKFIWAAKNDDILAFPLVSGDNDHCSDNLRGCAYSILSASNDGGKKFSDIKFSASNSSGSKEYTIVLTDDAIYIKSDRYSAKYVVNVDGSFIQPREILINDIFYKKMLAMGIPDDTLDKRNLLDVNGSLLSTKYSYTNEQLSDLGSKISTIYYEIRDSTPQDKTPNLVPFPQSTTHFSCNLDLLPRQPKNQG